MSNISGVIKSIRDIMRQDTGLNGDAQRIEQLGWMLFLKIFSDKDKELELMDDNYKSPIPDKFHWINEKGNWAGDDEGMTGDELLEFVDQKLFTAMRNIDLSVGNGRALIVREVFMGNNNYMKSGINIRKVLNKLNELDFNLAKERHTFGEIYEGILKDLQSAGKSGEYYTPRAVTNFITEMINPVLGEKILDPSCGTGGYLTAAIEHLKEQANSVEERQSIQENIVGWEFKPLPYLLATTNLILHDIELPKITFRDSLDQPLSNYKERDRVDVILANPPFGGIVANNNEKNFPLNYRTKESADLFLVLMIHLLKNGGRAGIVLPDGSLTGEGVKHRVRERLLNATCIPLSGYRTQFSNPMQRWQLTCSSLKKGNQPKKFGITNTGCQKDRNPTVKPNPSDLKNLIRLRSGGIIEKKMKSHGKLISRPSLNEAMTLI